MANSSGYNFPSSDVNPGDLFFHLASGGVFRYLGGNAADVSRWLLCGGILVSDPNMAGWGAEHEGSQWYNSTENRVKMWNGVAVVYPFPPTSYNDLEDLPAVIPTAGDYLSFPTPASAPTGVGDLYWDGFHKTLSFHTTSDTTIQIGQETVIYARNESGTVIPNGAVIRVVGGSGKRAKVALADAAAEARSYLIGLSTQEMRKNEEAFVCVFGVVNDVTSDGSDVGESWVDGDMLWLSATPGKMTKVRPTFPNHGNFIGHVVDSQASERGAIFIHPLVGFELGELHDVVIMNPRVGDRLVFDGAKWVNQAP